MKKIILRFKIAWKAFLLKPFEVQLKPFEFCCTLYDGGICDNQNADILGDKKHLCHNNSKVALAETIVTFDVKKTNYYHVCEKCAKKFNKSKEKYIIQK